jgi:hypothetical protein
VIREEAAHYSGNLFDVVEALLIRMQHLDQGVLRIGTIPDHALGYWTHRHTNQVILTAERRRHYLERHPEVASFERDLLLTLIDPCIGMSATALLPISIDAWKTGDTLSRRYSSRTRCVWRIRF